MFIQEGGVCFSHTEITEITEKVLFIEEGGISFSHTEITEITEKVLFTWKAAFVFLTQKSQKTQKNLMS